MAEARSGAEDSATNAEVQYSVVCPICMDDCGREDNHLLVSLKCGHLFGRCCAEEWILREQKCPTCKKEANLSDMSAIFLNNIIKLKRENEMNGYDMEQKLARCMSMISKWKREMDSMQTNFNDCRSDIFEWEGSESESTQMKFAICMSQVDSWKDDLASLKEN